MRELGIDRIISISRRSYKRSERRDLDRLFHRKEDVFSYVQEGEVVYIFGDRELKAKRGDIIYLPQGAEYRRKMVTEDHCRIMAYFRFNAPLEERPAAQVFSGMSEMEDAFLRLYKTYVLGAGPAKTESMALLYQIYAQLLREGKEGYLPKERRSPLEKAVHTINEQFADETLSVAALAERAGMSAVHFRRCFKALYHLSPLDYIIQLRIAHAKELLVCEEGAVAQIAAHCGFSDPAYFARIFKKKTGYTPAEYRKTYYHDEME